MDVLLRDPDARRRMGESGRARVEAEFHVDREAARLAALIRGEASPDCR
jgi:glycosyltransferase involved in cell wall biosynthesis